MVTEESSQEGSTFGRVGITLFQTVFSFFKNKLFLYIQITTLKDVNKCKTAFICGSRHMYVTTNHCGGLSEEW